MTTTPDPAALTQALHRTVDDLLATLTTERPRTELDPGYTFADLERIIYEHRPPVLYVHPDAYDRILAATTGLHVRIHPTRHVEDPNTAYLTREHVTIDAGTFTPIEAQ